MQSLQISAFSIQQAFKLGDFPKNKSFIDFSNIAVEDNQDTIELLVNIGHIVGYTEKESGENINQIQTQVENAVVEGEKKWKIMYLAVYDSVNGLETVPNSLKTLKKETIDIAREASAKEKRDVFVLIGRIPDGFSKCTATVLYKPAPKQKVGLYTFLWKKQN